jgi:hypothetical protein
MLSVTEIAFEIRRRNDPEKAAAQVARRPWTSRHLVAVAQKKRTACKGAQQKE